MAVITPEQDALENGTYALFDIFDVLTASGGIDTTTNVATTPQDYIYDGRVEFYGAGLGEAGGTVSSIRLYYNDSDFVLQVDGLDIDYDKLQAAVTQADGGDGSSAAIYKLFKGYDLQFDMSASDAPVLELFGTGGSDDFKTGSAADALYLDGGGDSVNLGAGDDTIVAWNYFHYAGKGVASLINGGAGTDTLALQVEGSQIFTRGQTVDLGGVSTTADKGVDFTYKLKSVENVIGSSFGDHITGSNGANVLNGLSGDDMLDGGKGKDTLVGSLGADDFVYRAVADSAKGAGRDVITDFEHKIDDIDLSALHPAGKHDKFTFIGDDKFDHHKIGEVRVEIMDKPGTTHDLTLVQADLDGNGKADMEIEITGLVHLDKSDFML